MKIRLMRNRHVRNLVTAGAVALAAFLQVFVIQTFIMPANLLSGGFTGVAILIEMLAERMGGAISTSLGLVLLNLPVAILCSRSISVRFTAFSLAGVFLTSFFLKVFQFKPLFEDVVLNVVFGGVLFGASIVIALRGNASTGGTDFIALYVSNRTGKSIWSYVFAGNVTLLVAFGFLFGWEHAGYSIIFQFISTKMISAFHHRYDRVTLLITTVKGKEIVEAFIKNCRHGISSINAVGGYSKMDLQVLHTVVSSYEVADIVRVLKETDPHIIINLLKTEQFYGGFYQAPIE